MRFLIDENVRQEVIEFLKESNHDVLEVSRGSKDETIAELAKESKRAIITHDQDFTDILKYPPSEYSGIIRLRIHPPSAPIIINSLKGLLEKISSEEIKKKLVILEKDGFSIR